MECQERKKQRERERRKERKKERENFIAENTKQSNIWKTSVSHIQIS